MSNLSKIVGVFLVLGLSLFLSAKVEAKETLIACENLSLSGVFEQCEEVVILEKLGNRIRAYSKPKQIVISISKDIIFVAKNLEKGEKVESHQRVTIAADRLWNTSKAGFQSLCEVKGENKSGLLNVNCGRYQNETIDKAAVFTLHPYSTYSAAKEKS
ncbi:MAG: hypothetical protein J0L93_08610 [Deltaproteobacteria bacterium]|nr:hypothetical protein [Deltaproteobacteria bacterium]